MSDGALPRRRLGRTALEVTELGFGGAALGNLYRPIANEVAGATLDAALDHGIRYVDTAPYYGFGLSERRIGDVVRGRDDIVLSTKVGRLLVPDEAIVDDRERHGFRSAMPFRPIYDYSHDGVMRSYEASLHRLGLDRIDLLLIHDIGRQTHGEAADTHMAALTGGGLAALAELRDSGAIGGVGIGVNEVAVCNQLLDAATLDMILLAGRYTLLEQDASLDLLDRCHVAGTSVVIGGPYNSGILATGVGGGEPAHYDYGAAPRVVVDRVAAIEAICARHGVPLAAAALRFPLAHPAVAAVIPGIDCPARAEQTLALYRADIPKVFWEELRGERLIADHAPLPEQAR